MHFARPGAAFLLLLLPALVLLHTRGGRRVTRVVPSLALWADVPDDARGRTAAKRPPISLSLILQALALVAATGAVMSPGPSATGAASRRIVLVVDVSASMAATDVAPSRLGAATAAARGILDAAPRGARVALILAGPDPLLAVAFTSAIDEVEASLPREATDGAADLPGAVSLARAVGGETGALVHVFTDTGWGLDGDGVRAHVFGGRSSNVALSDLTVVGTGADECAARLRVTNHSDEPARVPVVLTSSAGAPLAKSVSVAAGSHVDIEFDDMRRPADDLRLTAHATVTDDLTRDNYAHAVLPARRRIKVAIVGERPGPLATLVGLDALAAVDVVAPGEYLAHDDVALTVFHRWAPDELPPGDIVILGPPQGSRYAPGAPSAGAGFLGLETHPLLRLVDMPSVTVGSVGTYGTAPHAFDDWDGAVDGLMRTSEGPAAVSLVDGGRHILVIGFDPFDLSATDMSLQPALVVLVANLLETARERARMVPPSAVAGRAIPGVETSGAAVAGPVEHPADDTRSSVRAGIHAVTVAGRPPEFVAVNIPPEESDLRSRVAAAAPSAEYRADGAPVSHWRWYAVAALCLLSAEWATHHRRRAIA